MADAVPTADRPISSDADAKAALAARASGGKPAVDPRQYLDPATLAKVTALELRARLIIEGLISGMHRSPYHGFSVEFAEHRDYVAGDDIKYIDWKVFGRTDKHYVKQYEQETNLHLVLMVDVSESMTYKSADAPLSKYEYACAVGAAMAYLALRQQDSVGLALFSDKLDRLVKASNHPTYWRTLIQEMHAEAGPRKTSPGAVLHELAERLRHRSLVVVLSDLFGDPEQTLLGLKHMRYKRHEAMVLNVLDPAELSFPFEGPTLFQGLEQFPELLTEPRALRRRYLEEVSRFTEALSKGCRAQRMDYAQLNTAEPVGNALSAYLATRGASIQAANGR